MRISKVQTNSYVLSKCVLIAVSFEFDKYGVSIEDKTCFCFFVCLFAD